MEYYNHIPSLLAFSGLVTEDIVVVVVVVGPAFAVVSTIVNVVAAVLAVTRV